MIRRQDTEEDIYDEVTEDQYHKIVKDRLDQFDFVEDDGVEGYNDHGMDDWDDMKLEKQSAHDTPQKSKKPSGNLINRPPVIYH